MGYAISLATRSTYAGFQGTRALLNTTVGRGFSRGVAESFGWEWEKNAAGKMVNTGFLGRNAAGGLTGAGKLGFFGAGKTALASKLLFGPGMMAYSAYTGYQEGGVFGAMKNVGTDALMMGAFRGATAALGGLASIAGVAALGVGLGIAGYAVGESMQKQGRRVRNVEMGAGVVDPFGTISTIRQRSLSALQNSHANGRMALGNEAVLMHMPIMR